MMIRNVLIGICAVLLLQTGREVAAQERVVPLVNNPAVMGQPLPKLETGHKLLLSLPFREDFSDGKWYPNPLRWSDAHVFVNHSYPVGAPSIGVATFDALGPDGAIYPSAASFPFSADTLTSQPIDLSALKQSDSVYLSFYYQPQGIGNAPERDDSLLLEFWSVAEQEWIHRWADRGRSLNDFVNIHGKSFARVTLPVDSALFFSSGFRFRFRNYASITDFSLPDWGGNVDQWHLDYIYLNSGRSIHDTLIRNDLTFRDYPQSLLKKYRSMPWNQYLANAAGEMHHEVEIPFSAYYQNVTHPVNMRYTVTSLTGGTSYTPPFYNYGNLPMPYDGVVTPSSGTGFNTYLFNAPSAPYADFELLAWIQPFSLVDETIRTNDTVRFYQKFYNYYAYDDGTAEAGYGLSASNPNARLKAALRFGLNVPDTLRSVQIYFNQTKDLANDIEFTLTIWEATTNTQGDTIPGDTLLTMEELRPEFPEGLNRYHTYVLDRPVAVSGMFYIGWQQKVGTMLHVGYDRNHDSKQYLNFSIGGEWLKSAYEGTVMIRPVLGASTEAHIHVPEPERPGVLTLFPNPVSEMLNLRWDGVTPVTGFRVEVYNLTGQRVLDAIVQDAFDVSALSNGLYMIRVSDAYTGRLLDRQKIMVRSTGW